MELSGETEICGTHVAAAPGRRRRNQQVNVKASVETIGEISQGSGRSDDRTVPLGECLGLAVDALEGT